MAIPLAVENEREERGIDPAYDLPTSFSSIVLSGVFWRSVQSCVEVFDPVCKCLGVLKSDSSTLSTAYASFLFVYAHLSTVLHDDDRTRMLSQVLRRWGRIWSPVHALAFVCDPYYYQMRLDVALKFGVECVQLGKGDLHGQCRDAIRLLTVRHEVDRLSTTLYDNVVAEFMMYCISEEQYMKEWGCIKNVTCDDAFLQSVVSPIFRREPLKMIWFG